MAYRAGTYEVKHARINATADGDNTVIAAVANKSIILVGYALTVTTASTVNLKDGASTTVAQFALPASGGVSYAAGVESPAVRLSEGNAFIINNAASNDTLGHCTYFLVDSRNL